MSNRILDTLNRFKCTLIYGVLFAFLGGMTLAIPFAIGGFFVDWRLSRNWTRNKIFINFMHHSMMVVGVFAICTFFMANGLDPVIQGGKIADLFPSSWVDAFIDQMARYVPIIANYKDAVFSWENPEKSYDRVFLMALAWYLNFLAIGVFIGDAYHAYTLLRRNNYYVETPREQIPRSIEDFLKEARDKDGNIDPQICKKRYRKMLYGGTPLFIAMGIFALYLGYFGLPVSETDHISTSLHATVLTFCSVYGFALIAVIPPYGLVLKAHSLYFAQKNLNNQSQRQ